MNVWGATSHSAELTATLRLCGGGAPALVCLNETFLDSSTEDFTLEEYNLVARRDQNDGRRCGGVAIFARTDTASNITLIEISKSSERIWLVIHSDVGPYLLGV